MDSTYGWYKNNKRSPDPVPCKWCGRKPTVCGQMLYCNNFDCGHNPPQLTLSYEEWQKRNKKKERNEK
jgi:hypothetical protein